MMAASLLELGRDVNLRRERNEKRVQISFISLNQMLGSLMQGVSLSTYSKHGAIWQKISRQQSVQFQHTIKFKV